MLIGVDLWRRPPVPLRKGFGIARHFFAHHLRINAKQTTRTAQLLLTAAWIPMILKPNYSRCVSEHDRRVHLQWTEVSNTMWTWNAGNDCGEWSYFIIIIIIMITIIITITITIIIIIIIIISSSSWSSSPSSSPSSLWRTVIITTNLLVFLARSCGVRSSSKC